MQLPVRHGNVTATKTRSDDLRVGLDRSSSRELTMATNPPNIDVRFKRRLQEVEAEHGRIFALMKQYIGFARSGVGSLQLLPVLDMILWQTRTHCLSEEQILQSTNHPGLATQQDEHKRILGDLADGRERMVAGQSRTSIERLHLLDSLIVHHVREENLFEGN